MPPDVFAHKPAHGPDLQSVISSVVQACFNQFAAQAAIPDNGRDAGVGEDDDIPFQHVIKNGQVAVNGHLKTTSLSVVRDFMLYLHRFIFIPI